MFVCLLSWTFYVCLFVKLDISWLFVCLTGLCYDFGGQKMATRWRWHTFKLKNMKFSLLFSGFWWIFADFLMIFWNFKRTLWHPNPMFGRSPQCQFCLPQNLTKHFETSQKLWKTFGNSQKEPRNLSKMDFLWISTNFHEFSDVPKPKTKQVCTL